MLVDHAGVAFVLTFERLPVRGERVRELSQPHVRGRLAPPPLGERRHQRHRRRRVLQRRFKVCRLGVRHRTVTQQFRAFARVPRREFLQTLRVRRVRLLIVPVPQRLARARLKMFHLHARKVSRRRVSIALFHRSRGSTRFRARAPARTVVRRSPFAVRRSPFAVRRSPSARPDPTPSTPFVRERGRSRARVCARSLARSNASVACVSRRVATVFAFAFRRDRATGCFDARSGVPAGRHRATRWARSRKRCWRDWRSEGSRCRATATATATTTTTTRRRSDDARTRTRTRTRMGRERTSTRSCREGGERKSIRRTDRRITTTKR